MGEWSESVLVRLKRPEGYEDVHPELILQDANINPAFEPELVSIDAPGNSDGERAAWLADKIVALGDYAKEAAEMLRRWPHLAYNPSPCGVRSRRTP